MSQLAFEATPVQTRLMELVTDGRYTIIGFGGGVRSTKTWGTLSVLIALCRIFPGSRWAVVRKDLERLRQTTLPSFEKLRKRGIESFISPVNLQTFEAICTNGSVILFRGENIDKDPELLRWHGFEVNGFDLEEADELQEQTLVKSIERAGAWVVPSGEQPPPFIFCTFNPNAAWPRRVFYEPWKAGTLQPPYAFIPATIADNPHAPESYRESLKLLPDHEYKRFVIGDWEVLTGRYYETLNARVHLVPKGRLPSPLPDWWEYWGAFDWGWSHWAVFCAFARDTDGVTYLLDSVWQRKRQDADLAKTIRSTVPLACLGEVYAGHDCWAKEVARSGSGITTAEVFEDHGIYLLRADLDRVNGGRALRRALQTYPVLDEAGEPVLLDGAPMIRSGLYLVDTPGNRRVLDQVAETMPDPDNIEAPLKVDSDAEGRGGDDGVDAFRYGIATRLGTPALPFEETEVGKVRAKLDQSSRREAEAFDRAMQKALKRRTS